MEKFERHGKAEELEIKSSSELEEAKHVIARYQEAIEKYEASRGNAVSREPKEAGEKERALVEMVKDKVYKELEDRGRLSPLARIGNLENLLKKEAPGFNLEMIIAMDNESDPKENLWLLAGFVSPDRKRIYVIPGLDIIVGPSEVLQWFDGGRRYDGTQSLGPGEVQKLALGEWDSRLERWVPKEKGVIRTRYEQGR